MEWFIKTWDFLINTEILIFPLPVFIWLCLSYLLSTFLFLKSKGKNFPISYIIFAPIIWPIILAAFIGFLVIFDVAKSFVEIYKHPISLVLFVLSQVFFIIPNLPNVIPSFILRGGFKYSEFFANSTFKFAFVIFFILLIIYLILSVHKSIQHRHLDGKGNLIIYAMPIIFISALFIMFLTPYFFGKDGVDGWTHNRQYFFLVFFAVSSLFFYSANRKTKWFYAISLTLFVLSAFIVFDLIMSQIYSNLLNIFIVALSSVIGLFIEGLREKDKEFSNVFRTASSVAAFLLRRIK